MAASSAIRYGEILFGMRESQREEARLSALSDALDPESIRAIRAIGATDGWRALDVGCGIGSLATKLSRLGLRVTGIDRDDQALSRVNSTVTTICADIETAGPHLDASLKGSMDVIHARCIAMYLSDPTTVVARLASWLKPGGWIVLCDPIKVPATTTVPTLGRSITGCINGIEELLGTDMDLGRQLPQLLSRSRLSSVDARVSIPTIHGGESWARFLAATIISVRESLDRTENGSSIYPGLSRDEVREAVRLLEDPGTIEFAHGHATAWGQRPARQ